MALVQFNRFRFTSILLLTLSVAGISAACPCFNHDHLIRKFQNREHVSCHIIVMGDQNVLSVRISDKYHIANASSTNCQLTSPHRTIANDYDSYQQQHQNCILEVI